jgi:hypothetical protein
MSDSSSASASASSASVTTSGPREVDRGNRGIPKATFIVRLDIRMRSIG